MCSKSTRAHREPFPSFPKRQASRLASVAALVMSGNRLPILICRGAFRWNRFFIKSPVFPFAKFPGVDPILSPEMHSTGEVWAWATRLAKPMARQ